MSDNIPTPPDGTEVQEPVIPQVDPTGNEPVTPEAAPEADQPLEEPQVPTGQPPATPPAPAPAVPSLDERYRNGHKRINATTMREDYPDINELRQIEHWPLKSHKDYVDLAEFVCNLWHYDDWATLKGRKVKTLRLATGGWSGNEDILKALDKNFMFGMTCWEMSKRGGLHIYKVPNF